MARSNDSSNDPPAGGNHEQLSSQNQDRDQPKNQSTDQGTEQANEQPARPGMSGAAAPGPQEDEALEAERGPGARRLHKIADASHTLEGSAYTGAMEAALSVPIAMGLGYWADDYFETTPIFLIAGTLVGFAAMVLRLMRMRGLVSDASASPEEPSPKERDERDA